MPHSAAVHLASVMQDFGVSCKTVLQNWRARKISHASAKHDLVMSRDPGVIRACAVVDFVQQEQAAQNKSLLHERPSRLEASLGEFVDCPQFHSSWLQFRDTESKVQLRFKSLLFVGASRSGKTQRASGFCGMLRSLVVNCQGLQSALPSLREFTKEEYDCIIYDEVTERQVLSNKLVFQSGPKPVTLGQSPCGAFQYTRDLYAVPMILCSNDFKRTLEDGLSEEEVEWLDKKLIVAELPEGAKAWFCK
jgi:hypothetical protein